MLCRERQRLKLLHGRGTRCKTCSFSGNVGPAKLVMERKAGERLKIMEWVRNVNIVFFSFVLVLCFVVHPRGRHDW